MPVAGDVWSCQHSGGPPGEREVEKVEGDRVFLVGRPRPEQCIDAQVMRDPRWWRLIRCASEGATAAELTTRAPTVWSERHTIEALRRCYELAGKLAIGPTLDEAMREAVPIVCCAASACDSEQRFRQRLGQAGFDEPRVNREVRRVDGLVTGQLVREQVWRVGAHYYSSIKDARAAAKALQHLYSIYRVNRVCRRWL